MRDLHRLASIPLDHLLESAVVDTYYGDFRVTFPPNDTRHWKEKSDFLYGLCFTLELPERLTSQVVRKVTFITKMK